MKTQTSKTAAVMGLISRGRAPTLADSLSAVSNLDTNPPGREQLEYIDISSIFPDQRNFYEVGGIDELAASIELVGLQQPLRVRPGEAAGTYTIVSGHRRYAALFKLSSEGQEGYDCYGQVPCIVEHSAGQSDQVEEMLQELRLIYGNSNTRRMTAAEISRQAERVETLLYQLKEAGVEFPGRMRDHVAEACKVSAPKLARLKVIREGLEPAYMDQFQAGRLPELSAYALARLPRDMQGRLLRVCQETPSGLRLETILRHYQDGWRWEPKLICPDGKACGGGDRFLRHDCEDYNACGGLTCCLDCPYAKASYNPCARMCSKAKAQRKECANETKAAEEKRRIENGRKYQEQTKLNAQRLAPLLTAAGLKDSETISWRGYRPGIKVSTILGWAGGVFDDPAKWTEADLDPRHVDSQNMAELARRLDCSTDYLLGLTDDPRRTIQAEESAAQDGLIRIAEQADSWDELEQALSTAKEEPIKSELQQEREKADSLRRPQEDSESHAVPATGVWMPGDALPEIFCDLVVDWDLEDGLPTGRDFAIYDGYNFLLSPSNIRLDGRVVRWLQLPPVREDVSNLDTGIEEPEPEKGGLV